jgi:1-acyl-sn-glycerol-3-phosphate acyltransferase
MKILRYIIIIIYTLLISIVAMIEGLFDRKGRFHGKVMRHWGKMILFFSRIKLEVDGLDNLKDANPALIVMNHESSLDIPVVVAVLPIDLRFIFKIELTRFPIFGWALWLGNHIAIDRSNPKQAIRQINEKSGKIIKLGYNITISPEGTRSDDGKIMSFKKGGFRIAEKFDLPIISVTMIGNRFCNPKKSLLVKPGKLKVVIEKAVKVSDYGNLTECVEDIRQKMINHKEKIEPIIQEEFCA